jgi:hypothetical protein
MSVVVYLSFVFFYKDVNFILAAKNEPSATAESCADAATSTSTASTSSASRASSAA